MLMFVLGILQGLLVWMLTQSGQRLARQAAAGHEMARFAPPSGWPACALIIPVGGYHPQMDRALRSLLEQDYPDYRIYLSCAADDDPAIPLVEKLTAEYGHATCVIAGKAETCGQKNQNLLAGVEAAGDVAMLAFCDSTHIAKPDFLRCLIGPIARGECKFSTGYHQVVPRAFGNMTLVYAVSVLFMRLLQGVSSLAQLWGGAMAMSRAAFVHYQVAILWQNNVVDDCSLSAWLADAGARPKLSPAALLTTYASSYPLSVFRAWLGRQILFLKFCMPGQWLLLGLACLLMVMPTVWGFGAICRSLFGMGGAAASFLALCWLCFLGWAVSQWRQFIAPIGIFPLLRAFFCAIFLFAWVYMKTAATRNLLWQNRVYKVGKNGKVRAITSG